MSKKYIKQVESGNFVYPNNNLFEYDIDIIHQINDNSISGTVTTFSATTISTTAITISYDITWIKNGAEVFIADDGNLNLWSVHVMEPTQEYFSPFRMIDYQFTGNTSATTINKSGTFTFTNTDLQVGTLTNGVYNFEIRLIGHTSILPICYQLNINTTTPTPTPTPTVTPGSSPTPTPTPTLTPTPTSACTVSINWTFTETGGANGQFDLYVNGSAVETRTTTSSGTYNVSVGAQIYVVVFCDTCSEPDNYSNAYTLSSKGTLVDASCGVSTSTTMTTATYTVVSGDCGSPITIDAFATCDGACI